jgi:hypothetical protein
MPNEIFEAIVCTIIVFMITTYMGWCFWEGDRSARKIAFYRSFRTNETEKLERRIRKLELERLIEMERHLKQPPERKFS